MPPICSACGQYHPYRVNDCAEAAKIRSENGAAFLRLAPDVRMFLLGAWIEEIQQEGK